MAQARIQVKYVNPPKPGKANGSIKGADDDIYGVPSGMLANFQPRGTYTIDYSERQFNGQTYKTVTAFQMVSPPSQEASGGGKYGNKDDATAERIFVCGALNAHISSGQAEMSAAHIGNIVNILRDVWRTEMAVPAKNADMDGDTVPY